MFHCTRVAASRFAIFVVLSTPVLVGQPMPKASPHREGIPGAIPKEGSLVAVNPPTLRWMPKRGPFRIRLSQNPEFPDKETLQGEREWVLWNPHKRLAEGTWYWQLARLGERENGSWSQAMSFRVGKESRLFLTPKIEQMLAKVSGTHPRLLLTVDEEKGFRKRAATLPETEYILGPGADPGARSRSRHPARQSHHSTASPTRLPTLEALCRSSGPSP